MSDTAPSTTPWEDPRFDRDWGTRQEVYAAWKAGWDIDTGPPPNRHTVPPPSTTEGTDADGTEFLHNGIEPTDAAPLFHDDGSPTHELLQAIADEEAAR